MPTLNPVQAFIAMERTLDKYYLQTKSDDVGSLLGDISFLPDDGTADPGALSTWRRIIRERETLSPQEAFDAMKKILQNYYNNTTADDVGSIINSLNKAKSCHDTTISFVADWNVCLNDVLASTDEPRRYLELTKE